MNEKGIGIIGCGGIARGVHIPGILAAKGAKIAAICDINEKTLQTVGDSLQLKETYRFTDYRELIACDAVEAVEICTPNHLHAEMAIAALCAKKPINLEKPAAMNYEEALQIKEAGILHQTDAMVSFSYRFKPAVRYAKYLLEQGLIGDPITLHAEFFKSSAFQEGRRLDWRFIKKYAGTGVLGDLGIHLIDMTRFLLGEFTSVCARKGTVVKERKLLDSEEMGQVETDDFCNFLAVLSCGAEGVFSITRCAIGNENAIRFDLYGTKGVLQFDLNQPDYLCVCAGAVDLQTRSIHKVKVPEQFSLSQQQAFADLINGKKDAFLPDLSDGAACQRIADCLLLSSEEKKWVCI